MGGETKHAVLSRIHGCPRNKGYHRIKLGFRKGKWEVSGGRTARSHRY